MINRRGETHPLMESGPLGRSGGVLVFDDLPPDPLMSALANEAFASFPTATRPADSTQTTGPDRCRAPRRRLTSSPGGSVQMAMYNASWLAAFIAEQVGRPVAPSSNCGTYSYYVEKGDYLDLHVDVLQCDVTLITVVHDDSDPRDPAGGVMFYGDHIGTPLDSIDIATTLGTSVVKARPGQSVMLLGGLVPHRVLPISSGRRVISPLCFRATQ